VDVAPEDLAVEPQRDDTLLDARATGVVEADHRAADLHREVHDLDDLLAEDLAQGPAEDREVLREHRHRAPVDRAVARDDPVAVGAVLVLAEGHRAVPSVLVHLDEGPLVEEHLDTLARRLLPPGVLLLDCPLRPRPGDLRDAALEVRELSCRRGGVEIRRDVGAADGVGVALGHAPSLALTP
jgi:hypothetical protein